MRLDDIRYEVRDIQWLAGLLVDEGIADRRRIGATGISYGGGCLDDARVPAQPRRPAERQARALAVARRQAHPARGGVAALALDQRRGDLHAQRPAGLVAHAAGRGGRGLGRHIFAGADLGLVAPLGSELSADVNGWKELLDSGTSAGEPGRCSTTRSATTACVAEGRAAPLLFQSGWTDALFPVPQALAGYRALLRRDPDAPVSMQLGDFGHGAASHPLDVERFDKQGNAFLDAWLLGKGSPPGPGKVTALTQTCPRTAPAGGGPYVARDFDSLARGEKAFGTRKRLRITSEGASATLAAALNPVAADFCTPQAPDPTSSATFSARSRGEPGLPVLTGRVRTEGRNGQLDARVWDLDRRLARSGSVTRGTYRWRTASAGDFRFVLDGNGWRFRQGAPGRGRAARRRRPDVPSPARRGSPPSWTSCGSGRRFVAGLMARTAARARRMLAQVTAPLAHVGGGVFEPLQILPPLVVLAAYWLRARTLARQGRPVPPGGWSASRRGSR